MSGIGNFFNGLVGDVTGGINDIGSGISNLFQGNIGTALGDFGGAAMNAAPFLGMAGLGPVASMVGLGGSLAGGQQANAANGQYGSTGGTGSMSGTGNSGNNASFSSYLPLLAGLMGNQTGSPFGVKMYSGGPYADNGMGDNALNYANMLGNAGASQLQQGMSGLPGLSQMGAMSGLPTVMNMEAQLSGLPLNFSGLSNSQGSPYQLNTQAPGTMTPTANTGSVVGAANRGVTPSSMGQTGQTGQTVGNAKTGLIVPPGGQAPQMTPQQSAYYSNIQYDGVGAGSGGSPPIAGQNTPWQNQPVTPAGQNWQTPTNDMMNNMMSYASQNALNQGMGNQTASLPAQAGSLNSATGTTRDVPTTTTGATSSTGSGVTQTGALNPNQLPQYMQEMYNTVANDSAQGYQASLAGLQQQFAANGITDPRAMAAAQAQLSAGHSSMLADQHAAMMGQNQQNQQNQLNQFGNQLSSIYGAQQGQQQQSLNNAQNMIGSGQSAYQNAQNVALRQSALNGLNQSGLWGNLAGYGGGMGQQGMGQQGMGQQGQMNMAGTKFNSQTGQYTDANGNPVMYGPSTPSGLSITDPSSGIQFDPSSGMYFDPTSGTMIDPSMFSSGSGGIGDWLGYSPY